jgi:hypothetical protein
VTSHYGIKTSSQTGGGAAVDTSRVAAVSKPFPVNIVFLPYLYISEIIIEI